MINLIVYGTDNNSTELRINKVVDKCPLCKTVQPIENTRCDGCGAEFIEDDEEGVPPRAGIPEDFIEEREEELEAEEATKPIQDVGCPLCASIHLIASSV